MDRGAEQEQYRFAQTAAAGRAEKAVSPKRGPCRNVASAGLSENIRRTVAEQAERYRGEAKFFRPFRESAQ